MDNTQNQWELRDCKRRKLLVNDSDDVSKAQGNQPNYFDTLPDEVLLEIFKKLPQSQLDSVALVCRRFNHIIKDRSLWKEVVIDGHILKPGYIEKLMRRPVQHLDLCDLKIPLLGPTFEPSWCLKELSLHTVQVCHNDLVKIFDKCKQLTIVYLANISVNKDVFVALSENKNLVSLSLICVRGLQPVCLEVILRNVKKLQGFYIDAGEFNPIPLDWPLIIKSICGNLPPSLIDLSFGCSNSLTDDHVAQIVRKCPLLQCLHMYEVVNLTERSMESLRNLEHLRKLYMPLCYGIPPEAFLPLTEIKSLIELFISNRRNSEEFGRIERLFGVNIIECNEHYRIGTFETRLGDVVTLRY